MLADSGADGSDYEGVDEDFDEDEDYASMRTSMRTPTTMRAQTRTPMKIWSASILMCPSMSCLRGSRTPLLRCATRH